MIKDNKELQAAQFYFQSKAIYLYMSLTHCRQQKFQHKLITDRLGVDNPNNNMWIGLDNPDGIDCYGSNCAGRLKWSDGTVATADTITNIVSFDSYC